MTLIENMTAHALKSQKEGLYTRAIYIGEGIARIELLEGILADVAQYELRDIFTDQLSNRIDEALKK